MAKQQIKPPVNEKKIEETGAERENKQGKGAYHLIPPFALHRVALHYEAGGIAHGDRNWEKGLPHSSYVNSAMRHLNQYLAGDRSEDHLAAVAWNAMGLMHQEETLKLTGDDDQQDARYAHLDDLPRHVRSDEEWDELFLVIR